MTFDYGPGARLVGDPPVSLAEVREDLIRASGLELVGDALAEPRYDPELGPPVKVVVPTVDGLDSRVAEYTFGAVRLRRPLTPTGPPGASPG